MKFSGFSNVAVRSLIFLAAVAAGFFSFRMGYYFVTELSLTEHDDRSPAAIPKVFDYSHLDGDALRLASQERLVTAAKVVTAGNSVGIELGHFVTRGSDGRPTSACDVYDHITLEFQAGDMAVSGEPPTMTLEGICQPSDDINYIAPIMVQYDRIIAEPVNDKVITNFDDTTVTATFENVSDSWPKVWVLTSVRLFNDQGAEVAASAKDLRRLLSSSLEMEWR